jgi:hypothetical protein
MWDSGGAPIGIQELVGPGIHPLLLNYMGQGQKAVMLHFRKHFYQMLYKHYAI